jgi:hypothetical protein
VRVRVCVCLSTYVVDYLIIIWQGEPTSILLYESDSSKTLVSEHLVGEILLSQELRSGEAVTCLKLLIELTRQQGLSIRVCCQSTEEPVELRIPISE